MTKSRVMIADDERAIRCASRIVLENAGYEVIQASNGFEVIESLKKNSEAGQSIDLLLLDIQMPNCSGEEALKQIETFTPYPKVILMTGNLSYERAPTINIPQYSGMLVKPFDRNTLLATVTKTLGSQPVVLKEAVI